MDSRRTPRAGVSLEVKLTRRRGSPIAGHTEDLAPVGARVVVDRPLAVDEEVHFDLTVPGGDHIDGRARVVRQQRPDCYALRFVALDASTRAALTGVVEDTQ